MSAERNSVVVSKLGALIALVKPVFQVCSWPFGVFVISRAGLFVLAYLSLIFLPLNADPNVGTWHAFPNNLVLDGWGRWDAGWYKQIAENGYSAQPQNDQGQRNVVFFPLYPACIRALNWVTHNSVLSGILISNLAFGIALVLLFRLVVEQYDDTVGRWSVMLLATYPFSFYFSAVYTEALFLLTIVGAFYSGVRQRWALAAVCAACASATRSLGITVALGLLVLYLHRVDFDLRRVRRDILWLLLSPVGLIAYMGFLWYRFGEPLLFVSSRYAPGWEQGMGLPLAWQTVASSLSVRRVVAGHFPALNLLHLFMVLVAVLLIGISWRRLRLAYSVWAIPYLLSSFVTGWHGMGRYVLPVFPLFISATLILKREDRLLAVLYLNVLLLALFTVMFTHFYWVS